MADKKFITMLDLAKYRHNDIETGIIDEAIKDIPEFGSLPMKLISGTDYKTLKRLSVPHGSFRRLNEGTRTSLSETTEVEWKCHIFEGLITVDAATIKGLDGSYDALAEEGAALLEGSLQYLAKQVYYGAANDAAGFPGYIDALEDKMALDAGGSDGTSVWFVHRGRKGVRFVAGNDSPLKVGKPELTTIPDPNDPSKLLRAYVANMQGWYGLQIGHAQSVGRISGIDASHSLTDEMLAEMFYKFPTSLPPNAIYMTRKAAEMLHKSRAKVAALKSGGSEVSLKTDYAASKPADFLGVEIFITDAIKDSE